MPKVFGIQFGDPENNDVNQTILIQIAIFFSVWSFFVRPMIKKAVTPDYGPTPPAAAPEKKSK
eukprot:CAMPEP_0169459904 /NCGR_PEP_ID=MMETSP1042-20121227/18197_1 /TAXON_ID=464988 /ORGANISM="Hemiselmis andersenii, Strain CCMP1180" /LENGTH=62 /DNA_ID=CAMNT_0009572349 /DNA_START=28 /DNA_END=216 /DNA_ORIENTATION=+